ncbi:response regulator transcription factor [Rhizobium sp. BE258]|uniref:response regulator transcription factor n=2 Tax=Pseudomonadati TaxID=3379134 RepID=UPI00285A647B|nr:DNA-binding CsgD family transcriptional regulator [Rhizobium sp. BE258]
MFFTDRECIRISMQKAAIRETKSHVKGMTAQVTKREKEILTLMCAGKTAQEIALILGCSVHTVRTHIEALKTNFAVYKDTALVAAALRQGVID